MRISFLSMPGMNGLREIIWSLAKNGEELT
jgi:hypothetical protein